MLLHLLYLLLQGHALLLLRRSRVHVWERLPHVRVARVVSLRQGRGGRRHSLRVHRLHQLGSDLRRRMCVRVYRLRLRSGSSLERLQEGVTLNEGWDFRTGGGRLLVVLQQGLGRLCREGTQNAMRWG